MRDKKILVRNLNFSKSPKKYLFFNYHDINLKFVLLEVVTNFIRVFLFQPFSF